MNTPSRNLHRCASLLGALLLVGMMPATYATPKASAAPPAVPAAAVPAVPAAPAAPTTPPATPAQADQSDEHTQSDTSPDSETFPKHGHWRHNGKHVNVNVDSDDDSVFNFGGNANLAANDKADSVVSIMGSATSAGEVSDSVVSVLGNTHVTGPVAQSVVSVLGNAYVDSKVDHDVVAVLGNITLGPNADIGGDLVAVGGTVHRDPAAQVHGSVQNVGIENRFNRISPWFEHCFLLGRPLAFVAGIGWAWTLAFVALGLYLFAALIFAPAVEHCMQVLEKYPGQSLLTMILTIVATPIVFVILCVTIVGIIAVPFLGIALFLAKFFGKLVMLAWIGRRVLRSSAPLTVTHTLSAVLVGGLLVMLLYCVPVIGIVLYYLLGLLGLGVVIYTLLLQIQGRRPAPAVGATPGGSSPPPGNAAPQMSSVLHAEPAVAAAAAASGASASEAATGASEVPPPPAAGARSTRVSGEAAIALPRAGFWVRMLALLLDTVLVGIVMHVMRASDDIYLIALAAYGVVMWRVRGSTVGGIIFNLAVVRRDGREMDWGTAVVRALSAFLSLFALGLGFIWIAIDPENRSWHDKIAGTVVVRVP
jgi:uncharacterized RDD family membrane protein YckC